MSQDKDKQAHARKDAHLALAKRDEALAQIAHPFDALSFQHYALPDVNWPDISLATHLARKQVASPFFIGAMTGGTDHADHINQALAEVAESHQIALALGSQRASLAQGRSYGFIRKAAPTIPIIGNLGITQLAAPDGVAMAHAAIEAVEADILAIHLNPLQEAAQPEGDHDWRGCRDALARFISTSPVPVLVKEVGAGLHPQLAEELEAMGAAYLDVAGLGGTNWTRIETLRRSAEDAALFAPFLDWGIDSVSSLQGCVARVTQSKLIASGGIRHGLDVAKALALGASYVCAAGPFLKALAPDETGLSQSALSETITRWQDQLRLACFLTNCADIRALSPDLLKN